MTDNIVVFSGHAHRQFSEEMCGLLGVELSPSRLTRFSNDCMQVQLRANCRQKDVYIVQPLVPPTQENLMELLMMVDAARGASAAHVNVVMPHYAYARSDKKDAPRISLGGRLVADLISAAGASRVLTMALHAEQVHGFFSVPVDHLSALGVLSKHFRDRDLSNAVVVSPDFGNAKQANSFARMLKTDVAAGAKRRMADDSVVIDAIVGDVRGRDAIVLDDEIATAGSIVTLVEKLQEAQVRSISVVCTHGLFTGNAVERLNALEGVTEIVTTDTLPQDKPIDRMTVISVAPLFAEAIRRIHLGESVSKLLSDVDTYGV
ncbi:ribose-phosphate diphosphokinase [Nigerium massiliense]|uniref:ribose-phosphate diphosphokinase n=1 Tax=Nigerium massiliense TaxID=1522317 RepID=UPI00058BEB53|nr:ribose-phosphate diphosphokinase [Nigerium massiliense]